MTDREMLELAALAYGFDVATVTSSNGAESTMICDLGDEILCEVDWNPLADDGDALRLAVKLSMDVLQRFVGGRRAETLCPGGPLIKEPISDDPLAATRRAIVRAAAEIGRQMKEQQP